MVILNRHTLERQQKIVTAVDEITGNIQNIKLECYEMTYASKVVTKVMKFLMKQLEFQVLSSYINGMSVIINSLAILVCVVVRITQNQSITLSYWLQLQLLTNLFLQLRVAITEAVSMILQLLVNEKRLFAFLQSDNVAALPIPYESHHVLQIANASCAWNETPILQNVDLNVQRSEKTAIIGKGVTTSL